MKNGKIKAEGHYVDSKREGEWIVYYESRKVKLEGIYVEGKGEGKFVWYDEEGNINDEDIYENGVCVEMCEGDEDE